MTTKPTEDTHPSSIQITVALLFGTVLALVGWPASIGAGQSGEFIGLRQNYLHDTTHLLFGVAGLVAGAVAGG